MTRYGAGKQTVPVLGESVISIGIALEKLSKLAQFSSGTSEVAAAGTVSHGFPASTATGMAESPVVPQAVNGNDNNVCTSN